MYATDKTCAIWTATAFSDMPSTDLQANALRRDRLQATAVMETVRLRVREDSINIKKIVPQQLLNRMWFGGLGYAGVILDAPKIKDSTVGTKAALHAAKGVGRRS